MRPISRNSLLAAASATLISTLTLSQAQQTPYLHAPSVNTYATHDPDGITILLTRRTLKPVSSHIPVDHWLVVTVKQDTDYLNPSVAKYANLADYVFVVPGKSGAPL